MKRVMSRAALASVLCSALGLAGLLAPGPAADRALAVQSAPLPIAAAPAGQLAPIQEFTTAPRPGIAVAGSEGGPAEVGNLLVALPGVWEPAPTLTEFQWLRGCEPIEGATMFDYRVRSEDAGQQISVRATAHRQGYRSTDRVSVRMPVAGDPTPGPDPELPFVSAPVPTIGGGTTAKVGVPLTVTFGTTPWDPAPERLSYQWLRGGVPIPGATSTRYTPTVDDLLHELGFRVTACRSGYLTK